jgi:hypothetical protein
MPKIGERVAALGLDFGHFAIRDLLFRHVVPSVFFGQPCESARRP